MGPRQYGGDGLLQTFIYCGRSLAGFYAWERTMRKRLTSWEAYLAGRRRLPPGYELEYGADVLLVRRADGSTVAAFSARGVAPSEVVPIAEEDYRANGRSSA
jgi:hypothetical protein